MPDNVDDSGAHIYQRQRHSYLTRRLRIGALVIAEFLAFLPFVAIVAIVERRLFSTNKFTFPAGLLWGAIYLFTGSRLRYFPCPRCAKNFFGGFFATPETVMGRNCANCGLRKYEGE